MATDAEFMAFVMEQLAGAGTMTSRRMFGEYAVYRDGLVVALVCDNRLFVKPTDAGLAHAGEIERAPPYPGAKPYLLVEDRLEDREWLCDLIRATARALAAAPGKKGAKKRAPEKR